MKHLENDLNGELLMEVEKTYQFPNTIVFNLAKEKSGDRVIITHEVSKDNKGEGCWTKPSCVPHMELKTLGVKKLQSAEEYVTEYTKLSNMWLLLEEISQ